MQTAYINAYLHLDAFRGHSSFTTWLTKIMINECLGQKRRNNWVQSGIESPENISSMKTLDIAPSNVKTRLNRAKTMLRGSLQGYMKEHVYNFHLLRCDRIVAAVLGAISSLPDR
jgi:RNA polymerase sigma-70 factor (ECF subfamily)